MRTLRRRIQRLEALQAAKVDLFEYWFISGSLPEDYVGERHLVVKRRLPHYVEAEEQPGPGPQDGEPVYVNFSRESGHSGLRVYG